MTCICAISFTASCRARKKPGADWRLVFPNGTAREAIEKRTTELAARGRNKGDAKHAVIGGLIQDICDGTGIALGVGRADDRDIHPRLVREQREVMQALVDRGVKAFASALCFNRPRTGKVLVRCDADAVSCCWQAPFCRAVR